MDIRKPKPIHNWREFLKEVGTIVLGVSIALAAEQGVEYVHWRNQVRQAREVIATEMAQNIGSAIVAWRATICTERRLDELAQILDKAAETGRLPPLGDIGRPPRRTWRTGAWDTVVASQTATHFPRQQLADLAGIYSFVRLAADTSDFEAWIKLYTMVGPGRRLAPSSETELRQALTQARAMSRGLANVGSILIDRVQAINLPFNKQDLAVVAALRFAAQNSEDPRLSVAPANLLRGGFGICQPIGAVPAHYGQSMSNLAPVLTDERMKTLPRFEGQ
jgi:hypothetical protein